MKIFIWTGLVISALISNAMAFGTLTSQRVSGFERYCAYSDGGVETVGAAELCPITNQGTDGRVNIQKSIGFGSLSGQQIRGFNRICDYTNGAVLTVGAAELCPITSN